jgi:hypothetical protein
VPWARADAVNTRASSVLADAIDVYLSIPRPARRPSTRPDVPRGRAAPAFRVARAERTAAVPRPARARAFSENADSPRASPWGGCPVRAERVVHGARDERWVVREVDARAVPGAQGERCLILENHDRVRRLWNYPAGWSRLPDETLIDIAESAVRRDGRRWRRPVSRPAPPA